MRLYKNKFLFYFSILYSFFLFFPLSCKSIIFSFSRPKNKIIIYLAGGLMGGSILCYFYNRLCKAHKRIENDIEIQKKIKTHFSKQNQPSLKNLQKEVWEKSPTSQSTDKLQNQIIKKKMKDEKRFPKINIKKTLILDAYARAKNEKKINASYYVHFIKSLLVNDPSCKGILKKTISNLMKARTLPGILKFFETQSFNFSAALRAARNWSEGQENRTEEFFSYSTAITSHQAVSEIKKTPLEDFSAPSEIDLFKRIHLQEKIKIIFGDSGAYNREKGGNLFKKFITKIKNRFQQIIKLIFGHPNTYDSQEYGAVFEEFIAGVKNQLQTSREERMPAKDTFVESFFNLDGRGYKEDLIYTGDLTQAYDQACKNARPPLISLEAFEKNLAAINSTILLKVLYVYLTKQSSSLLEEEFYKKENIEGIKNLSLYSWIVIVETIPYMPRWVKKAFQKVKKWINLKFKLLISDPPSSIKFTNPRQFLTPDEQNSSQSGETTLSTISDESKMSKTEVLEWNDTEKTIIKQNGFYQSGGQELLTIPSNIWTTPKITKNRLRNNHRSRKGTDHTAIFGKLN